MRTLYHGHFFSRTGLILRAWLSVVAALGLLRPALAPGAGTQPAPQETRYVIIVTGGELLAGAYADGHTHFLTQTLRPLGLRCAGSMCVDDKQADLHDALRFATGRAPLVLVTGGLGPTDNDITREALSDFTRIPLQEHADVLEAMARRFRVPAEQLRANLRRQTRVPTQGRYLPNANGTAVGLVFEMADSVIAALPGPPHELQPMVHAELVPYLARRFGTRLPGCALTLRFVGLGQSEIDQRLKDHVTLPANLVVSSQFEGGRVDFTFSLPDDTAADRARLRKLKDEIVTDLGDHIYAEGDTSLEQHIVNRMVARGETLVLLEAGSGGRLAAALTTADDADRVLAGAYVAPTMEKLSRLLGVPDGQTTDTTPPTRRMEQLITAVRGAMGRTWLLAVGHGTRDENGASVVEVTLVQPDGTRDSRQVRLGGAGETALERLTTQVLDQLRRSVR